MEKITANDALVKPRAGRDQSDPERLQFTGDITFPGLISSENTQLNVHDWDVIPVSSFSPASDFSADVGL